MWNGDIRAKPTAIDKVNADSGKKAEEQGSASSKDFASTRTIQDESSEQSSVSLGDAFDPGDHARDADVNLEEGPEPEEVEEVETDDDDNVDTESKDTNTIVSGDNPARFTPKGRIVRPTSGPRPGRPIRPGGK